MEAEHNSMSAELYENRISLLEKQRAELLEVNKQWDHQFRQMKQLYETKILELKVKLTSSQLNMHKEQSLNQKEKEEQPLSRDKCTQHVKCKEEFLVELQEMKVENQNLRRQNAMFDRRKEHYECEISRLNKALLDAVTKERSLITEPQFNPYVRNIEYEDMLTQIEVLKQQIQIYEEDFKRERSDRERISEKKDELQKMNDRLRFQLSHIKTKAKENKIESVMGDPLQQQPDYQWYVPDQLPPDVQQKENGASLKRNPTLK
ncbi:TNFAIP3-interacting protein 3 isoform 2-T3 [Discoglossus pictus]